MIYLSGDIETNPGPITNYAQGFKICHWNLNSIATDNFVKIPLLEAYAITHNFDIVCLSETYLDSSYSSDDPRLQLSGYSLVRADHPMDTKRGGVCIYYKEYISLICKPKLTPLDQCLVCELKIGNKKCFITVIYRSPTQSLEDFEKFKNGWENTILNINNSNPYLTIFIGDFNARNTFWCDSDIINTEGLDLSELSSHHNLHQLINTPTHILPNSESCIDLLFTSQPNLISESGVHASLFPRCHHQIIYANINLKIYYPPPYEKLVWDYSKANITNIRMSLSQINWVNDLRDLNVNDQVDYLTNCISNVFTNFVPNKIITCKDKDPPWMTEEVNNLCHNKAKIYEKYVKNGRSDVDKQELASITKLSSDAITKAKEKYLSSLGNKLNDPQTGAKSYWSILNKFLQKKKIPLIPPILVNGTFITKICEKITIFNRFFADQCTLINNNNNTLPPFEYKVNSKFDNIAFTENEIISIIRSLNHNKAHGWDAISIRMIKICDESIVIPLKLIFESALKFGVYPDKWKKANVIPVHKKESKNLLTNYRPISLLPVCGKIFEKCIYNSLYGYLQSNDILSKSQSGFRKGDSCISQLLAITHEIYSNFDAIPSLETRGVFLDISKAFDRVWHEGLLFKLKSYGINGPPLTLIKSFLSNRFQRVVLNGQTSNWKEVLAGVPQGSILGPLFFLIFINDIPEGIQSNIKIFADDTSIFSVLKDNERDSAILSEDLNLISNWAFKWKMSFNPDPSKQAKEIVFSKKRCVTQLPVLMFNNNVISSTDSHKHLGMILDSKLSFIKHLKEKISKANKGIGIIRRLYNFLPRFTLINI